VVHLLGLQNMPFALILKPKTLFFSMETNPMPNVCNDFVSVKHGFHHLKYYDIVLMFLLMFFIIKFEFA